MQPGRYVLLETFLNLEAGGDDDEGALGKKISQQRGQKRLGRFGDAGARQCAAFLQAPLQGLHSRSLRDGGEKFVCHRT